LQYQPATPTCQEPAGRETPADSAAGEGILDQIVHVVEGDVVNGPLDFEEVGRLAFQEDDDGGFDAASSRGRWIAPFGFPCRCNDRLPFDVEGVVTEVEPICPLDGACNNLYRSKGVLVAETDKDPAIEIRFDVESPGFAVVKLNL
jgi:hypothetical protein